MGILDRSGTLRESVLRARDRGVLFDVGHGNGPFSFRVAGARSSRVSPPT